MLLQWTVFLILPIMNYTHSQGFYLRTLLTDQLYPVLNHPLLKKDFRATNELMNFKFTYDFLFFPSKAPLIPLNPWAKLEHKKHLSSCCMSASTVHVKLCLLKMSWMSELAFLLRGFSSPHHQPAVTADFPKYLFFLGLSPTRIHLLCFI